MESVVGWLVHGIQERKRLSRQTFVDGRNSGWDLLDFSFFFGGAKAGVQ